MAASLTLLTSAYDETDSSGQTTASISPAANSGLLVFTFDSIATGTAPRSVVSGLSLTWEQLGTAVWSGSPGVRRCSAWWAQCGSSPGSGALTLTRVDEGSGTTGTGGGWSVIQVTDHNTTTPVPQIVLTATSGSATSHTMTLGAPVDANSRPVAFFAHRADEPTNPRTNWTELSDNNGAAPSTGIEAQWRSDAFETTASASWVTSSNFFGIALEIAAAGGAVPAYPNITTSNDTSATAGPVSVNMPADIVPGNLLIAATAADNSPTVAPGGGEGWSSITDTETGGDVRLKLLAKIAAGGDTLNLTLGASQDTATHVFQVEDHGVVDVTTDIVVGTPATGTSATPDPPAVTPAENADNLIIAFAASDDDDDTSPYAPTDYTPQKQLQSANSSSSSLIQVAYRKLQTTGPVDPGTFSLAASEQWVTQTICIPPSGAGSQLVDCQQAAITITGQAGAITEGAATKAAQQGTVTITGQAGARNAGPITKSAQQASLTIVGVLGTLSITTVKNAQQASIAIAGQPGAITEGAATKSGQTAALSIAGVQGAVNEGVATKAIQPASVTVIGQAGTITLGAATKQAQQASVAITGVSGTFTYGAVIKTAQVASLALAGQSPVVTEGAITRTAQVGAIALTGQSGANIAGGITRSSQVAELAITGQAGTASFGLATKTAQVGALAILGVPGSTTAATTINCQTAELVLSGQAGTASFGPATIAAQVGALALAPQPGSISRGAVTRSAQVGALALSGVSGANTLGTATKSASPSSLSLTGAPGKLELRVECQPAILTLARVQGSLAYGAVTKEAQVASLTISGRPGSTSGVITVEGQTGVLAISAVGGSLLAGPVSKSAAFGVLAVSAVSGTVTEGVATIAAQVATLALSGVPGSLETFGAPQTKNCQPASLSLSALPGSITVEATVISCQTAVVTIVGTANVASSQLTFNASTGFVSIQGQDGNWTAGSISKSAQVGVLTLTGRNGQPVTGQGQPQTVECSPAMLQLTAGSGAVSSVVTVQAGVALLLLAALAAERSVSNITKQGDPALLTLLAVAGIPLNKAIQMAGFSTGGALRYATSTGTIRLDSDDGSLVHATSQGGIESSTDDGRIVHSTSVGSMA